jgi:hypothetical protein
MFQAFASRAAAVAMLVAVSSPSFAGGDKKPESDDRVICKVERSSTSRIAAVRRCKTAGEWQVERKRAEGLHADRENYLLRNPQNSSGSLGVPADLRGTPN